MTRPGKMLVALGALALSGGCDAPEPEPAARQAAPAHKPAPKEHIPKKVDFTAHAMGTAVHVIAYTTDTLSEGAIRAACDAAMVEIQRLEALMSSWRDDTDVGRINRAAGKAVKVSAETFEVFEKAAWSSRLSDGAFDVSFNVMADVWRFGDAAEDPPQLPDPAVVERRRALIDYEKVELDSGARTIRIGRDMRVGLGGIAKGYAVDRAGTVLERHGVTAFLLQAGGDLLGRRTKPDGSKWVSGIQDPRGPRGTFFATIELEDHAFSTAGDYARAFVIDGKRYHHIIDPRTGYPATASRSVTVWAENAFVADAIDDAVFILGPKRGLALVESLPGVGAVIVTSDNRVVISKRLEGAIHVTMPPTDGI